LPDPLSVPAHVHFQLVLLRLREGIPNFATGWVLRTSHAARGIGHLFFEVFQLVGHPALFLGQTVELLLGLPRLDAGLTLSAWGAWRVAQRLPQTVLKIGLVFG
jgi:hypothetical protein